MISLFAEKLDLLLKLRENAPIRSHELRGPLGAARLAFHLLRRTELQESRTVATLSAACAAPRR